MRAVSTEFNNATKAKSRMVKARAVFEVLKADLSGGNVSIAASSEFEKSVKTQITDNNRYAENLTTNEKDYVKLDGSFKLMPEGVVEKEIGYASNNLSNINCEINETIVMEMQSSYVNSKGIGIVFDREGCYATDFTIKLENTTFGTTILSESISGNKDIFYRLEFDENSSEFNKITIEVSKLNLSYRRLRITEIDFGLVEEWDDKDIIDISLVEEIDYSNETMPTGTLSITIDNFDGRYNLLNQNGIFKYLTENKTIKLYFGVELESGFIEWCDMGKYFLKSPKQQQGNTIKLECKDFMGVYENILDESFELLEEKFEDFASRHLLSLNGEPMTLKYPEEPFYDLFRIVGRAYQTGLLQSVNRKDLIHYLAITLSACCLVREDGEKEKLIIKFPKNLERVPYTIDLENSYEKPTFELLDSISELTVIGNKVTITDKQFTDKFEKITLTNMNYFEVKLTKLGIPVKVIADSIVLAQTYNTTLPEGYYDSGITGQWCVKQGYEVIRSTYGLKIRKDLATEEEITEEFENITITSSEISSNQRVCKSLGKIKNGLSYEVDLKIGQGYENADYATKFFLDKPEYKVIMDWRGNPALEPGDKVRIVDANGDYRIIILTKNTFSYTGYLKATSEGVVLK